MTSSILVGALLACWCSVVSAQWVGSAEIGADRFWGGSIERGGQERSFRPYRPTTGGVGLERRGARLGAGLRLRYASASLALEGGDALSAIKGVFEVYSLCPEVVYMLTSLGSDNQLLLRAGPIFEVWSIMEEDSQTRAGVQASISLRVPVGSRLAASFGAGGALIASPFITEQLEAEDFEPRALWRRRVAGGLEYRL
jgi:hypothetical protein